MSVGQTFEDVLEVGERVDIIELGGGQQRSDDRPARGAAVGASKQVVLAAERNLLVILPISGRRSRSTIAGTLSMGVVSGSTTASTVSPAALCMSRRHPAWLRSSQPGCWIPWFALVWRSARRV
jgi:hypothetical protein